MRVGDTEGLVGEMTQAETIESKDGDRDARGGGDTREEIVARYKSILRQVIERNPSGLRMKIAKELGTHKSFLSQITNPSDPTPIPARHIRRLFELCHFTKDEQRAFTEWYDAAHPKRGASGPAETASVRRTKTIRIEVPVLGDAKRQEALEAGIRAMVETLVRVI